MRIMAAGSCTPWVERRIHREDLDATPLGPTGRTKSDGTSGYDEEVPFSDCRYEAAFSWIEDEASKILVVSGPDARLKPIVPLRALNSATELRELPTKPVVLNVPNVSLSKGDRMIVCDEMAFRNPSFPHDATFVAMVLCGERWHGASDRHSESSRNVITGSDASRCAQTETGCGPKNEQRNPRPATKTQWTERLKDFDIVASRRTMRNLQRFLLPQTTPYNTAFSFDVDIIGTTCVFTNSEEQERCVSLGYGRSFEELLVEPAKLNMSTVCEGKDALDQRRLRNVEKLTSTRVVYSMRLFGAMRVALSAEVDAVSPQFYPLHHYKAASCCPSDQGCRYAFESHASYECLVHRCENLSEFEEHLRRGYAPLVELKSKSQHNELPWTDTAIQMRLGGVPLLLFGVHYRGRVKELKMIPADVVEKNAEKEGSDADAASAHPPLAVQWYRLLLLLQKLYALALDRCRLDGGPVGSLHVSYSPSCDYLLVTPRDSRTVRLSAEVVSWLK